MTLDDYVDCDNMIGLRPNAENNGMPGSQNSYHYTGLAYVLTGDRGYMEAVSDAFDKFGYHRNSVTNDKVSYDDLHVLAMYRKDVRWDFINRIFWHPARESNAPRWWFVRQPCFIVNVLFPFRKSLIRDLSIASTGIIGKADADSFKTSFLISELYPTREFAKRQLRKRALKRFSIWDQTGRYHNGLTGAFEVYFGVHHPLVQLSHDFEVNRNEKKS